MSRRDAVEHWLLPIILPAVNIIVILQVNKHAPQLLRLHSNHLARLPDKVMCFVFFCIPSQAETNLNNRIPIMHL